MWSKVISPAIQLVTCLFAVFGGFLGMAPPVRFADLTTGLASFLALGLYFVVRRIAVGSFGKIHNKQWGRVAVIAFAVGLICGLNYYYQLQIRTFDYPPDNSTEVRVSGTEYTDVAAAALTKPGMESLKNSNSEFVFEMGGNSSLVWDKASIKSAELILTLSYVAMVLALLFSVFLGAETFRPRKGLSTQLLGDLENLREGGFLVFLSYRRRDSAYIVGTLKREIEKIFGENQVFLDVYSIGAGKEFDEEIKKAIDRTDVMLVVIGKTWTEGIQRDNDYVRLEIARAIEKEKKIIPIFVYGQEMPTESELPEQIRDFTKRNGIPLRTDPDFDSDLERVLIELKSA